MGEGDATPPDQGVFWGNEAIFRVWRLELTCSHCPIVTVQGLACMGFDTSANSSSFLKLHDSYPISQRCATNSLTCQRLGLSIIDLFLGPGFLLPGSFRQ
jgi:hypothetical protein